MKLLLNNLFVASKHLIMLHSRELKKYWNKNCLIQNIKWNGLAVKCLLRCFTMIRQIVAFRAIQKQRIQGALLSHLRNV